MFLVAIGVRLGVNYSRVDAIRLRLALYEDRCHSFGTAVAVTGVVERTAAALLGQHAETQELQRSRGSQCQMSSGHDGSIALLLTDGVDGELKRKQRAGAGGVDGERRTLQVERVRDAIREHRPHASGQGVAGDGLRILRQSSDVSDAEHPTNTPVREPRRSTGLIPASTIASQATSRSMRT